MINLLKYFSKKTLSNIVFEQIYKDMLQAKTIEDKPVEYLKNACIQHQYEFAKIKFYEYNITANN